MHNNILHAADRSPWKDLFLNTWHKYYNNDNNKPSHTLRSLFTGLWSQTTNPDVMWTGLVCWSYIDWYVFCCFLSSVVWLWVILVAMHLTWGDKQLNQKVDNWLRKKKNHTVQSGIPSAPLIWSGHLFTLQLLHLVVWLFPREEPERRWAAKRLTEEAGRACS